MDLSDTLARLAADPGEPVDLAAVALHLAADEYPGLDISAYLGRIDALAAELAPRLGGSLADRVAALADGLFAPGRFRGNVVEYYDPRNSYLNDVLDRGLGIPITLSVLAVAVGRRCGLAVTGVGLPGHFVARADADGETVLFDPFHGGRQLDRDGCEELVRTATGQPFRATAAALRSTPPGLVVRRLLTNLKGIYLQAEDFPRAAVVQERILALAPDDPTQRRDLGVCLARGGRPGAAIEHLRAYLDGVPHAADAEPVAAVLAEARRDVARWN